MQRQTIDSPSSTASSDGIINREEQVEHEDPRLFECRAPGGSQQGIADIPPLGWRQNVQVEA
jgi:hypothetical protein